MSSLPDDEALMAWVDGRLAPEELTRVAAAIEADPALRARAAHYRRQNEALRAQWAGVLDEAVPPRLMAAARGQAAGGALPPANQPRFRQVAGLALALGLGLAGGWFGRAWMQAEPSLAASDPAARAARSPGRPGPSALPLTRAAAVAHAAYVPEVRHPVEVGANEQAHLVAWLSKRLGTTLRAPNLEAEGFRLMGGRLLPDDGGVVAAQFMFENAGGQRLTLFVRRDPAGGDTAFRYVDQGGLGTFYWLDRGFGYALSGDLPREVMLSVAGTVYRQLNP